MIHSVETVVVFEPVSGAAELAGSRPHENMQHCIAAALTVGTVEAVGANPMGCRREGKTPADVVGSQRRQASSQFQWSDDNRRYGSAEYVSSVNGGSRPAENKQNCKCPQSIEGALALSSLLPAC